MVNVLQAALGRAGGDERAVQVPASALSVHMQQIWRVITEQKDLDLPAHKVMVASIRCKDIAREQLEAITSDQAWSKLLAAATAGSEVHSSFRADAAALVESCLFGYDSDAMYFVDSVRSEQKRDLEAALYGALHGAYAAQATLLRMQLAAEFRAALEAEAARPEHRVQAVAAEKLPEFLEKYERARPPTRRTLQRLHAIQSVTHLGACRAGSRDAAAARLGLAARRRRHGERPRGGGGQHPQ